MKTHSVTVEIKIISTYNFDVEDDDNLTDTLMSARVEHERFARGCGPDDEYSIDVLDAWEHNDE